MESAGLFGSLMVVCGLNVTVLCGLGELELEDVGGGRSGDVSVEDEAMVGTEVWFPHPQRFTNSSVGT